MSDIVIIDDNPDNLNLLAGILRGHDYRVRPATSPLLALMAVQREMFQKPVLDDHPASALHISAGA